MDQFELNILCVGVQIFKSAKKIGVSNNIQICVDQSVRRIQYMYPI